MWEVLARPSVLCPGALAPLLWFGSRLLFSEAFPQFPGKAGGQDEASVHLPLLHTYIPGLRLS